MQSRREAGLFGSGLSGHLGVINESELVCFDELQVVLAEGGAHFDQRRQVAMLSSQRGHALGVLYRFRIGELALDLAGALERVGETIPETQVSGVAGAASRVWVAYF